MTRWEHKIAVWEEPPYPETYMADWFRRQCELMLDRYGEEGWELVNIRNHSVMPRPQVWTIWKRPKV